MLKFAGQALLLFALIYAFSLIIDIAYYSESHSINEVLAKSIEGIWGYILAALLVTVGRELFKKRK